MKNNNKKKKSPKKLDILKPYKISIIDKYILKLFLKNLISSLVLFIFIYLFSLFLNDMPYLIKKIEQGNKNITFNKILTMYMHQVPNIILWISPLSFIFSTIYTLGNLYKNNEAVAYISSGVHLFRMNISIVIISFIYSISLIPFTEYVIVDNLNKARELRNKMIKKRKHSNNTNLEVYGENNMYFFIKRYNIDKKTMEYPIIGKERVIKNQKYKDPILIQKISKNENLNKKQIKTQNLNKVNKKQKNKTETKINTISKKDLNKGIENNKLNKSKKDNSEKNELKTILIPKKKYNKKENHKNKENIYQKINNRKKNNKSFFQEIALPKNNIISNQKKEKLNKKKIFEKKINLKQNISLKKNTKKAPNPKNKNQNSNIRKKNIIKEKENKKKATNNINQINNNKIKTPKSKSKKQKKKENRIKLSYKDINNLTKRPKDIKKPIKKYIISKSSRHYKEKNLEIKSKKEIKKNTKQTKLENEVKINSQAFQFLDESKLNLHKKDILNNLDDIIAKENLLKKREINIKDVKINTINYKIRPLKSHFIFRIDAEKATWNESINKWILHKGQKRTWHKNQGLSSIKYFNKYILKESIDRPKHFEIKKDKIENLKYKQAQNLVSNLKRTRRKWKSQYIDIYSKKISFQLSTFLIVFVGISNGKFHSRKLNLINSLFIAILLFITYFIIFQFGISLSKIWYYFPIDLAPWVGNIIFLVYGIWKIKTMKT